jgi:hypothetical protein
MKTKKSITIILASLVAIGTLTSASAQVSQEVLDSISTPDKVETSIGTLNFFDGAPSPETAEKVHDYLDTMRGVDTFLKGMQLASLHEILEGHRSIGLKEAHQIVIFDKLMDSSSLYLTGNTSTLYNMATLDLHRDGPTVIEAPSGTLGLINDAAFDHVVDMGPTGPDKGKGGKYLILPPGYEGDIPKGYFVVKTKAYRHWVLMRASIADGLDKANKLVQDNLKIYPLSKKDNQPAMEFISASGKAFNTVHANDFHFYEELNAVIQYEPYGFIDAERRGLFASIGIEKGKEFKPDARMKKILIDAVAIGNATARSIVWYPAVEGTLKGIPIYPGTNSLWIMGYADKNPLFNGKDGHTMNSDARVMMFYPYTGVSPAMALTVPGKGSDYALAYLDANKMPFDGGKTYKLNLPANVPAQDFWAITIYDSQTRSMLQTSQKFPTVGSQTEGIKMNDDGSYDLYFGPKAPKGYENNWLETIPGKSWLANFRLYGPLAPWLEQTWRPSEIELVK